MNRSQNLPEIGSDVIVQAAAGNAALGGKPLSPKALARAAAWVTCARAHRKVSFQSQGSLRDPVCG